MKFDRTERRVLGALVEKRWTTPDQYPLTLNALVSACNQKSNRDPVLRLEPFEVEGCLLALREKGYVMQHESHSGRVPRFGERMADKMDFSRHEIAILAELMLRGPQTPGELLRRCGRMAPFAHQASLDEILHGLARRMHVEVMPKQSGQRYARWRHLLGKPEEAPDGPHDEDAVRAESSSPPPPPAAAPREILAATQEPEREWSPLRSVAPASPAPAAVRATEAVATGDEADLRAELEELRAEVAQLQERLSKLESLWA